MKGEFSMNLKRKIKKVAAISLATLTIAVTGVSVYATTYSTSVRSASDYYFNYPKSFNSNCICAAGYSQLSGPTTTSKEVYYKAYGYVSGVGFYDIYGADRKNSGTMSNCKTSTISITSEIKRGVHRFVLKNNAGVVYDDAYIITQYGL